MPVQERLPLRIARKAAFIGGIGMGAMTAAVVMNKGMDALQPLAVTWACVLSASLLALGKEPKLVATHRSLQHRFWYRLFCIPFGWVWRFIMAFVDGALTQEPRRPENTSKNPNHDQQMIEFMHGMRGPPD